MRRQVWYLGGTNGYSTLPCAKVRAYRTACCRCCAQHADILEAIRTSRDLSDDTAAKLKSGSRATPRLCLSFFTSHSPPAGRSTGERSEGACNVCCPTPTLPRRWGMGVATEMQWTRPGWLHSRTCATASPRQGAAEDQPRPMQMASRPSQAAPRPDRASRGGASYTGSHGCRDHQHRENATPGAGTVRRSWPAPQGSGPSDSGCTASAACPAPSPPRYVPNRCASGRWR